jgi:endonuclease-8
MAEGDTLHRTAAGLRPHLVGRSVTAARARAGGPQVDRVVGTSVTSVDAVGKNLLIRFDNGLALRTHLRMHGSWHRYRPGESWRRPAARARVVLEVPGAVAVCFDAPVVELFDARAEAIHPALSTLGPDLLAPDYGPASASEAHRRLREPGRAGLTISAALLDQRALAGIGNIWRNETLWHERVDPWVRVRDVDDETLDRLIATAHRLLSDSAGRARGRSPKRVYGRAGRPCARCGTLIRLADATSGVARITYWCPNCQAGPGSADADDRLPV